MTEPYPPQDGQPPPVHPTAPPTYPAAPPTYPGQPGYPGTPPYPVYQPLPPYNTYAILALVFAIAILPPLGIYFGAKAKQQIAVSGERGLELAKAGYITGWVLTGIYLVFFLIWCAFAVFFLGMFGLFGATAAGTGMG
jgi:Domain of unknown function (DUF4190)